VDTRDPDVRIQAFLTATHCTLYIDTSGESLFKRGYRADSGEAPLKENLAAGIVMLTGWDRKAPLFDPMCGGGTLLIEAALMALNRPPGADRDFGFQKLSGHDAAGWNKLKKEMLERAQPARPLPIYGSDISGRELRRTRDNLAAAGLEKVVVLKRPTCAKWPRPRPRACWSPIRPTACASAKPRTSPLSIPNWAIPSSELRRLELLRVLGDPALAKLIRLKATKRTPLFNGRWSAGCTSTKWWRGARGSPKRQTLNGRLGREQLEEHFLRCRCNGSCRSNFGRR